jgi:hypothetical protein
MLAVEKAKVKAWRDDFGLQGVVDLGCYFMTHQEAVHNAGRAVADEWARIRGIRLMQGTAQAAPAFDIEEVRKVREDEQKQEAGNKTFSTGSTG